MASNYGRLVQQLRSERSSLEREIQKLTKAINALEGGGGRGRRGRRRAGSRKAAGAGRKRGSRRRGRMSAATRKAVSLRMKKYWAARRQAAKSK